LLVAIIEGSSQLNCALDERIVSDEAVRPYCLDQLLFPDQATGIFHQVTKRFINLGAKLNLFSGTEKAAPGQVKRELTEVVG
jgi:hypothetical protein